MAKYHIDLAGNIFCEDAVVGTFSLDNGQIFLEKELAASAENTVKALIFDLLVKKLVAPAVEVKDDPKIPPPPDMDPRLGDKTPAYMAWMETHFPEKYKEQYKGRRTHLTTGRNPHLDFRDVPDEYFGRDPSEEHR